MLHIFLAVGLFSLGRAQVAPGLIDRDGIMGSFAFDSYEYQREASRLIEIFQQHGAAAWAAEQAPLHVKLISIQFAILGPLFGYSTLSAEPFNLLCYVAILAIALVLGREVGGERAGLLAAGMIAVWPTFLLHTTQLLKDPFFIACALVLVLWVSLGLTRKFGPRGFLAMTTLTSVALSLLLVLRPAFAIFFVMLFLIGFALLVIRQLRERRPLYWNMVCPLLVLVASLLLLVFHATIMHKTKFLSNESGRSKTDVSEGIRLPTVVTYVPHPPVEHRSTIYANRFYASANRMAAQIGSIRQRFALAYAESGSNIDPDVGFSDLKTLMLYLPRAFKIGSWAPFPMTWLSFGKRVGSAGRLIAGGETLVMYTVQLLALGAVLRPPRRLAALLLLSVSLCGVTLLALVVSNGGALYRFRYTFWMLLIILGAKGFEAVRVSWRLRPSLGGILSPFGGSWIKRTMLAVGLACIVATAFSPSPRANPIANHADSNLPAEVSSGTRNADETELPTLSLELVNLSPATIQEIYVSPSDSKGWEENVLGSSQLGRTETVGISFNAKEKTALWDIKVAAEGKYAVWKGLDLRRISRIRVLLSVIGEPVAIAEIE